LVTAATAASRPHPTESGRLIYVMWREPVHLDPNSTGA